ncbi:hypothetical protein [Arenimonas sp.]|jgi:hypothetical protein|uniref:hypothetical protein n=1 Tax=Arenimonas sp. TaxID=1872635 RepID=UPI0037BFCF54
MTTDRPRVFVFTYDRYETITTSPMLEAENIEHVVLCHSEEQKDHFIEAGRVRPDRIIATGEPRGLAYNRNIALDMMTEGEWAMFLVDDLRSVSSVDTYDTELEASPLPITMENQSEWRPRFRTKISLETFLERAHKDTEHAEKMGAHLVGFCGVGNVLFRTKKWTYNTFADGRAWMVQKTDLRFDRNVHTIDDLCWTALNIDRFGVTVNDNWILPDCSRYTAGGYGSISDRLEQKMTEIDYLVRTYPHLITTRAKKGWPEGSHAVLRRTR